MSQRESFYFQASLQNPVEKGEEDVQVEPSSVTCQKEGLAVGVAGVSAPGDEVWSSPVEHYMYHLHSVI